MATSHGSNSDLSNQLRRARFLKEGEKIKRFMNLLMSEIFLCVIIPVQLLHVALIHQPKLTFSENAILGCLRNKAVKYIFALNKSFRTGKQTREVHLHIIVLNIKYNCT